MIRSFRRWLCRRGWHRWRFATIPDDAVRCLDDAPYWSRCDRCGVRRLTLPDRPVELAEIPWPGADREGGEAEGPS